MTTTAATTAKLTSPQTRMLRNAADDSFYRPGKALAGLKAGKRTAYALEAKGLGSTYFCGSLIFEINTAGRDWIAAADADPSKSKP